MLIDNIFYILEIERKDLKPTIDTMSKADIDMFVDDVETVRFNNYDTKCVVKLKSGLKTPPEIISHLVGFTHTEILIEMRKPEWTTELEDLI